MPGNVTVTQVHAEATAFGRNDNCHRCLSMHNSTVELKLYGKSNIHKEMHEPEFFTI